MFINLLVLCILSTAPFAAWGALCALAAMDFRRTRLTIAAGFFLCCVGWGGLVFAALDFLYGALTNAEPKFWPLAMLGSVLTLSVGNAMIYLANRRTCTCTFCPARINKGACK